MTISHMRTGLAPPMSRSGSHEIFITLKFSGIFQTLFQKFPPEHVKVACCHGIRINASSSRGGRLNPIIHPPPPRDCFTQGNCLMLEGWHTAGALCKAVWPVKGWPPTVTHSAYFYLPPCHGYPLVGTGRCRNGDPRLPVHSVAYPKCFYDRRKVLRPPCGPHMSAPSVWPSEDVWSLPSPPPTCSLPHLPCPSHRWEVGVFGSAVWMCGGLCVSSWVTMHNGCTMHQSPPQKQVWPLKLAVALTRDLGPILGCFFCPVLGMTREICNKGICHPEFARLSMLVRAKLPPCWGRLMFDSCRNVACVHIMQPFGHCPPPHPEVTEFFRVIDWILAWTTVGGGDHCLARCQFFWLDAWLLNGKKAVSPVRSCLTAFFHRAQFFHPLS